MVTGGGVEASLAAGIGATVGTVVLPCVGTAVGVVAGAGIGLFFGWSSWLGVVHTARRLLENQPKTRKDGKDVYASFEIIKTSKLEEYPPKIHPM